MKIFSIVIVRIDSKPGKIVVGEYELSQFSYFQRGSIQEFMNFFSRTLAEKTPNPGDRQSVENQEYIGHIHTRRQDLSAVLIADKEYPRRVAFAVLNEALDQFLRQCPDAQQWTGASASVQSFLNNTLKQLMAKYQNPAQADSLLRVQKELDETKIVMHKTIESVLERGDRLEDLVAKSDELSTASKTFYKTAKKTNSCCHLM
ncbi:hypothetical protein MIR68_003820 [Amoeboaphelidium protococcarum]|nr:hypothetical protein MIR68_003820 [Amoeboaphelidium protococcarum]KAI3652855.1 hypothetical protein MP228_002280 [Amoeboaphelidium protococcarum]